MSFENWTFVDRTAGKGEDDILRSAKEYAKALKELRIEASFLLSNFREHPVVTTDPYWVKQGKDAEEQVLSVYKFLLNVMKKHTPMEVYAAAGEKMGRKASLSPVRKQA